MIKKILRNIKKNIKKFYECEISLNVMSIEIYEDLKTLKKIKRIPRKLKKIISCIEDNWFLIEELNSIISYKETYITRNKNENNKILKNFDKLSASLKKAIEKIKFLLIIKYQVNSKKSSNYE